MARGRPFLAIFLVLGACATGPEWSKPGVTLADFHRDNYECQRENTYYQQPVPFGPFAGPLGPGAKLDKDRYRACMRGRGWARRDDPPLIRWVLWSAEGEGTAREWTREMIAPDQPECEAKKREQVRGLHRVLDMMQQAGPLSAVKTEDGVLVAAGDRTVRKSYTCWPENVDPRR